MKGRLLTVEEVKKLMPGAKVYAEIGSYVEFDFDCRMNGLYVLEYDNYFKSQYSEAWKFGKSCTNVENGSIRVYEYIEEPKTYATWEVVKMLSENPKLKFKEHGTGTCKVSVCGNEIHVVGENGEDCGFCTNDEWTLIEEPKEVTFMEAFEAWTKQAKTIQCHDDGRIKSFYPNIWESISPGLILNGKWYIGEPS